MVVTGRYSSACERNDSPARQDGGQGLHARDPRRACRGTQPAHDVLATLWARRRVDDLMGQDFAACSAARSRDDLKQQITKLGLEYRLMTQFTSFVAVEEKTVTEGGKPRRVEVPVEMPEGDELRRRIRQRRAADRDGLADAGADFHGRRDTGGIASEEPSSAGASADCSPPVSKLDAKLAAVILRVKTGAGRAWTRRSSCSADRRSYE